MTFAEWEAQGTALFGADRMAWAFVCPSCGHHAKSSDWRDAGAPSTAVAFSCVGRWTGAKDSNTFQRKGGPCTYAGGGLITMNPVTVYFDGGKSLNVFAFAERSK